MPKEKKNLLIKASQIPGAGKGLYTTAFIKKGAVIVEYTGRVTTWKEIQQSDVFNAYVYYVTRNYVIDARKSTKSYSRYANDANGLTKVKGLKNNTKYVQQNKKVLVTAIRDIEAGEELFVSYGKEYWDAIRYNIKLEKEK